MWSCSCFQLLLLMLLAVKENNGVLETLRHGNDCQLKRSENNTEISIDWPLFLSCGTSALNDIYNDDYSDGECVIYGDEERSTVLADSSDLLSEGGEVFYTEDVNVNTSTRFQIFETIYSGRCFYIDLSFTIVPFKQLTCGEHLSDYKENRTTTPHKLDLGGSVTFNCLDGNQHKQFFKNSENLQVKWYRNCTELPVTSETYKIRDSTFEDAGVYSCSINYNGMLKFMGYQEVCVKHMNLDSETRALCHAEQKARASAGTDVELTAKFIISHASSGSTSWLHVAWNKTSNDGQQAGICLNEGFRGVNISTVNPNITCQTHDPPDACYLHAPSEEERIHERDIWTVKLQIKNVQESDYGSYSVELTTDSVNEQPQTCHIQLFSTNSNQLESPVLVGLLVILFVFLLASIVGYILRVYVRVYFKRLFGKAMKGPCKVYLTYHFRHGMNDQLKETLKTSVKFVEEALTRLGCEVFDENRDETAATSKVESTVNRINASDRIVVILISSECIHDNWSVYKLQKHFESELESKSKLILILGNEVRQLIQKSSATNEAYLFIKRAMKTSYMVKWKKLEEKDRRILFELEDAIPKVSA